MLSGLNFPAGSNQNYTSRRLTPAGQFGNAVGGAVHLRVDGTRQAGVTSCERCELPLTKACAFAGDPHTARERLRGDALSLAGTVTWAQAV
jgi:hypothetical protein